MQYIHLTETLPDEQVAALLGGRADPSHYHTLLRDEEATVYKPDGSLLCVLRKAVLSPEATLAAYKSLRTLRRKTGNRRTSTQGAQDVPINPIRRDGTPSGTVALPQQMKPMSNIIGYFDRYPRFPYCRMTAFTLDKPKLFAEALPFMRECSRAFAQSVPDRYAIQAQRVAETSPDFVIHGTAYSTVTVNINYPTAYHYDKGDLKEGFSCLSIIRAGQYSGGHLVFPRFGVAVDLQSRDLLLMDAHELHGNTPIEGMKGAYERVACVLYYRERMGECGSAAEELERAKNRSAGTPLYDEDEDARQTVTSR